VTAPARAGWLIPGGLAALGFAFFVSTGVGVTTSLLAVFVVGAQGGAGAYAWHHLTRGRASTVELTGMGLAVGTAAAVLCGLVVTSLGLGAWGWLLPAVVAVGIAIAARVRRGRRPTSRTPSRVKRGRTPVAVLAGLLVGAVLGALSLLVNLANYPLAWTGWWDRYHPDMLFFEALSTSLARYGPLDSVFLSGGQVRYHWLVYAWSGQVAEASAAAPFVVLTRVLPFTATAMVVLIAVSWAARLSRVPWVPSLAVALILSGGYVGATYGTILNFDSPSQAVSTAWLLALCVVFLRFLHGRVRARGTVLTVLLLAFASSGGKISSGAIGVGALGLTWAIGAARRATWHWRALAGAAAAAAGLVAAYLLVVSGSADPGGLALGRLVDRASSVQGLNPLNSSLGIVAGTLILTIAIVIRWAGAAWLLAAARSRWSPVSLLGLALAVTGVATVLLVSGGLNDTWFALAASAPLSIISAAGAGRAAAAVGAAGATTWITRPLAWAVAGGLAAAGVVTALWLTGGSGGNVWVSSLRWLGPLAALGVGLVLGAIIARQQRLRGRYRRRWLAMTILILVVAATPGRALGLAGSSFGVQSEVGLSDASFTPWEPFVEGVDAERVTGWSADQTAAGAWLRDAAQPDDIVLTNVTFSPLVPALTGLRTWVSGTQYQAPYGRPDQLPVLLDRERQSWDVIDAPTAASAAALCEAGVRWVWVDPQRTTARSWTPLAETAWTAPDVTVLELACP
jgi:hypothetical protein